MVAGRCFIRNDSNLLASVNLLEVVLVVWISSRFREPSRLGCRKYGSWPKEAGGRSAWLPGVVSFAMILICWPP